MVTLLACIERIPTLLQEILNCRKTAQKEVLDYLGAGINDLNQLVLIGSGTSNTACITAARFMEKVSGMEVKCAVPSDFCHHTQVYNPKALYIFVSQTGTSDLTRRALAITRERGLKNVGLSEKNTTPLAKEADSFLDMGCGYEEYPMRTIGYSTSVFTLMLLALEIGFRRGAIPESEYQSHLAHAQAVPESLGRIPQKTLAWMQQKSQWAMMRSDALIFTGAGALYGVALEAAVKAWETPKVISMGFELEEGLHGPNFGYNSRHCVLVLNDGKKDSQKARALTAYMREVWGNGWMVGADPLDDNDLHIPLMGGDFCCLELAAVPQAITYKLALDQGRDLTAPHDNSVMNGYFSTHSEKEKK